MDARSTATLQQLPAGDEIDVRLVERLGGPARRATS